MRIYILEDDPTVIAVLESLIEREHLGLVCGDSMEGIPSIDSILDTRPDIILLDFLMPMRDGVDTVRELRERGCMARCIMISQVSSKEMVGKAYAAGVDFFINKPINVIEVRSVLANAVAQLENERKLQDIGRHFGIDLVSPSPMPPKAAPASLSRERIKRIREILASLGMAGERGTDDIVRLAQRVAESGASTEDLSLGDLFAMIGDNPKTANQRVRRAIAVGLSNLASMGLVDYSGELFTRYAGTLFAFEDVRREMDKLSGRSEGGGKLSIRRFIGGLLSLSAM